MKNLIFLIIFISSPFMGICQTAKEKRLVKEIDVINAILGKNYYAMHPTLDSMGVWYYHHFKPNKNLKGDEVKAKVYSIDTGQGIKVYMIHLHQTEKYIMEVVVNFRHDDRAQIEAMKKMPPPTDWHVGTFSTDFEYKFKSKP